MNGLLGKHTQGEKDRETEIKIQTQKHSETQRDREKEMRGRNERWTIRRNRKGRKAREVLLIYFR